MNASGVSNGLSFLRPALLSLSAEQLRAWFLQQGEPAFRAAQVRRRLFQKQVADFHEMSDLPTTLRSRLAEQFRLWTTTCVGVQQAADGTQKLLLQLDDGQHIECVLLRDDKGNHTACISTQVGCPMKCVFCATGLDGLVRNLTTAEILEQLLHLQRLLRQAGDKAAAKHTAASSLRARIKKSPPVPELRLNHVVVMGMGEPLLNLDALLPALDTACQRDGLGIGARRITISTVGLPEGIRRLALENRQYHLAVSLHAAGDQLRNRLVPANRGIGLAAILAAADEYFLKTGRRVTYEYVLLAGVNDQPEHARALVDLLRGRNALVNLIAYNRTPDAPFRRPAPAAIARFMEILSRGGLNVHLRHRKGERIRAACGQLRRRQPTPPPA